MLTGTAMCRAGPSSASHRPFALPPRPSAQQRKTPEDLQVFQAAVQGCTKIYQQRCDELVDGVQCVKGDMRRETLPRKVCGDSTQTMSLYTS